MFTDRFLRSLKPAPKGKRVWYWDTVIPGFGVGVSDIEDADPARRGKAGLIIFILYARYAPCASPTRRPIGTYGALTLEEARDIAGRRRAQIEKGLDPIAIETAAREAEAREAAQRAKRSFAAVAEDFIADKLAQERRGKQAEPVFRNVFVAAWGERAITEIVTDDVLAIINAKKRKAPAMARALLNLIKRFFNWAIDQRRYGLEHSPCDRLKASKLIGDETPRNRRLNDEEIFAFWRVTGRMGYPVGPVCRLLLLTGCRLNEIARLSWSEVQADRIDIPASRMKGKNGKAREHLVPLSEAAKAIIVAVPRIKGANFLFSLSGGKRPLVISNQIKVVAAMIINSLPCPHGSIMTCGASFAPACRRSRSRITSPRQSLRIYPERSSAPTTCMSTWTKSARHWTLGRSGSSPLLSRSPTTSSH